MICSGLLIKWILCQSKDLRGGHYCTGLCGDVRDQGGSTHLEKCSIKVNRYLFLLGVTKYGPVISTD